MTVNQRTLLTALITSALSTSVSAYELKNGDTSLGSLTGKVQIHTIQADAGNGYDPSEGDSYLLKLKYLSPDMNGFKVGIGSYTNGNLFNSTDFTGLNPQKERVARGMFVTPDGASKTVIGEAYIDYNSEKFSATAGRQLFKTPLTKIAASQIPNFYQAYGVETTALEDFKLGLHYIDKMSFGSRAMTDWALIGEGTNSAGAAIKTVDLSPNPGPGQAEFIDIEDTVPGANDSNGITAFNANYNGIKGLKLGLSNFYVDDIANNFYLQADKVYPIKDYKLALSAQYLHQNEVGDYSDLDFDLFGLKATLKGKGWAVFGAYNHSDGDTAMLNAWGSDPAYTSSIFSRNAYRENVDAFKIGFKYKIMKGLTFVASHADYGKSDTCTNDSTPPPGIPNIPGSAGTCALTDAKETDLVLIYKPAKEWLVKAFYADRTSEYDGAAGGRDLTQEHFRIIASYEF